MNACNGVLGETEIPWRTTRAGVLFTAATAVLLGLGARAGQFEDASSPSGISQSSGACYGTAWGDYNNDGFPDLYITTSIGWDGQNFLFRNTGHGTFVTVGAEAGPLATEAYQSGACAWVDFNNDGFRDLFLLNGYWFNPRLNELFWNHGDGTFSRGQNPELTSRNLIRTWPACADFDGDGWVDVAISSEGRTTNVVVTQLYRATGQGSFTRSELGTVLKEPNACVWADYDNDGDPDLFVTDSGESHAWRNAGRGQFTALNLSPFTDLGSVHFAWGDYDNDGDLDIAVSHYTNDFADNQVFRNENGTAFVHAVTLADAPGFPAWADFDNDGYLDILVIHGQDMPRKAALFHNNGDGTFTRACDVFTERPDRWLTSAWADYDNDGAMDLLLTRGVGSNRLYHNVKNGNHWLKFVLTGTVSNRDAIGAKVRVLATIRGQAVWQMREVSGGFVQDDPRPNFGLGDATQADRVIVEWPSGNVQELTNQQADRLMTITEPIRILPLHPSASLGGAVRLTSLTVGSYQWRFDGVELAGQTSRTLSVTNLQAAQQGRYSVVVTSASGATTTNYTYLLVDTQFTKITEGLVVQDTGNSWQCSWVDYDRDGDADLFVLRHQTGTNALYRNDGDGGFTRITDTPFTQTPGRWSGGPWGDYDNDGYPDLYLGGFDARGGAGTPGHFYHNDGDGTFTESAATEPQQAWCASWADYNQDGYLDLFIPNWFGNYPYLFHNRGDGTLVRATTDQVGSLLASRAQSCAAAWADYDDDGLLDVFVGVLGPGRDQVLFRNMGAGYFTGVTNQVTVKSGVSPIAGVWADYDNDGRLDLFVANWGGQPNALYRNLGGGRFREVLNDPVVSLAGNFNSGAWGDYDNDGFLDLFVTQASSTNLLYHNNGDGSFTRVTTGSPVADVTSTAPLDGPAAGLWWDCDNDGFLDLFVANASDDPSRGDMSNFLYRNNGNANAWLKIKLEGTVSNRDGAGAKVRVKARFAGMNRWQRRDISAGDNYNGNNLIAHFGLGDAAQADLIRIEWPSGIVQGLANVPARQQLTVTEPPRLEALGEGRIRILCWKHQNYEVEVSDDLEHWASLGVVATSVNRPVVIDPGAAGHPHRFYRAKRP